MSSVLRPLHSFAYVNPLNAAAAAAAADVGQNTAASDGSTTDPEPDTGLF